MSLFSVGWVGYKVQCMQTIDYEDEAYVDEDDDGGEVTSGVKRGWVEKKELALPTSRLWR